MAKISQARKEWFQNKQKERNQSEEMSLTGTESDRSQNSAGAAASNLAEWTLSASVPSEVPML